MLIKLFWGEHMYAYFINRLWKRLRSPLLYFPSLLVPGVQWCQWNEPRLSKETGCNIYLVKRSINTPYYLFWHKPINLGSTKRWKSNVTFPNENSWSFGAISIWDIRKSMSFLKESFGFPMSFHYEKSYFILEKWSSFLRDEAYGKWRYLIEFGCKTDRNLAEHFIGLESFNTMITPIVRSFTNSWQ